MFNSEENSPLLMADGGLKPKKRVSFHDNHFRDAYFGATAVFTKFPNYIGSCWISTAFFGLLFFMMILLLISTITTNTLRIPRCVAGADLSNRTVHLVHSNKNENWKQLEFNIISKVIENYKDFKIHLILINNESTSKLHSQNKLNATDENYKHGILPTGQNTTNTIKNKTVKRKRRKVGNYHLNIDMEAKKLLDILLNGRIIEPDNKNLLSTITTISTNEVTENTTKEGINSLDDLIKKYPDIIVENTTYNKIFFNSPLYPYWPDMEENLRIFAVRVFELWQYGGISFDLQPNIKNNANNTVPSKNTDVQVNRIYNTKVMNFVITQKQKFDTLPENVVAADDEGLHMESKVPCHAFFGELLMNLRRSSNYTSVQDIIKATVSIFCKHYAGDKKYCNKLALEE